MQEQSESRIKKVEDKVDSLLLLTQELKELIVKSQEVSKRTIDSRCVRCPKCRNLFCGGICPYCQSGPY